MRSLFFFALLLFVPAANAQSTRALESFEQGVVLSRSGDHANALNKFETVLTAIDREGASDRFFAKAHYNLGVSLYHLSRLDAAVAQFEKALRYEQNQYEKAHYALGLAEFERGNAAEARDAFKKTVALNNRNGEAWFDLAFAHLAANESGEARRAFDKALKLGGGERVSILNNLGVLLAIEGKYAEAMVQFEAAMRGDQRSQVARENLDKCRKLLNGADTELLTSSLRYAKRGRPDRL